MTLLEAIQTNFVWKVFTSTGTGFQMATLEPKSGLWGTTPTVVLISTELFRKIRTVDVLDVLPATLIKDGLIVFS